MTENIYVLVPGYLSTKIWYPNLMLLTLTRAGLDHNLYLTHVRIDTRTKHGLRLGYKEYNKNHNFFIVSHISQWKFDNVFDYHNICVSISAWI